MVESQAVRRVSRLLRRVARQALLLVAEADGNRTRQAGDARLNGFEDRGAHQDPDASAGETTRRGSRPPCETSGLDRKSSGEAPCGRSAPAPRPRPRRRILSDGNAVLGASACPALCERELTDGSDRRE